MSHTRSGFPASSCGGSPINGDCGWARPLHTHLTALKAVCWEHLGLPAQVLCSRWEGAGSAEEVRSLKQPSTNEEKAWMGKQTSFLSPLWVVLSHALHCPPESPAGWSPTCPRRHWLDHTPVWGAPLPVSLPLCPTGVSWDHLPNEPLSPGCLAQGLCLGQANQNRDAVGSSEMQQAQW